MRRIFIICLALAFAATASAQMANVKKLRNKIDYATGTIPAQDYSNLPAEKVEEFRALIEPALTNEESMNESDLWEYAARLSMYDMNQMLAQRAANNNEFVDANAFFENQYDIVTRWMKYIDLLNTPNEKGKYSKKEEEREKDRLLYQQFAMNSRNNLFIAATNVVNDDPAKAITYLDLFYSSATHPLFADLEPSKNGSANLPNSYYIYATALKATNGDKALTKEYLDKARASEMFGKNALFDLMEMEKEDGNMDAWKKLCAEAIDQFPDEGIFGRMLIQQYINDKQYDEANALCDKLIAANQSNGTVDEWPYYFKAAALFTMEKYEEAYDAFVGCIEVKPDMVDALAGAGTTAWKLAQNNQANKDAARDWYGKAISHFEAAEIVAPDQPDKWGYSLYACCNNSLNLYDAKSDEYKELKEKTEQYKQYNK